MPQTKLANLINPEVMAPIISAKLPTMIKFAPLAKIDSTLSGTPGNTITVPKFAYIGDAEDVAEGVAMGTTILTASSTQATVKKAGKAVEITDESALSGYGDPVGEATGQLSMSISSKVDADCVVSLDSASLAYDGIAKTIDYDGIVNAVDLLQEEEFATPKVLFVHPKQVTQLRLLPEFKDLHMYPLEVVMSGVIGSIAGCQVVPSKRIQLKDAGAGVMAYENFIVKTGYSDDDPAALTIYLKRDVEVETDRDILAKTTVISADEHYTTVLSNDAKVVKAKFLGA